MSIYFQGSSSSPPLSPRLFLVRPALQQTTSAPNPSSSVSYSPSSPLYSRLSKSQPPSPRSERASTMMFSRSAGSSPTSMELLQRSAPHFLVPSVVGLSMPPIVTVIDDSAYRVKSIELFIPIAKQSEIMRSPFWMQTNVSSFVHRVCMFMLQSYSISSATSPSSMIISDRSIMMNLLRIGWPVSATALIQNGIALSSTLFVGHLGATELGGMSIGQMLCNLFGFALGFGFCSALDSLCSAAYGARRFHLVGLHCQRGAILMTLFCWPIAAVWSQSETIVLVMGVDSDTAAVASVWTKWMILGLWPQLQVEVIKRWLMAQRVVWPSIVASLATIGSSLFFNSLSMFYFQLGVEGAALATALSYWVMLVVLAACCVYRQRQVMLVEKTRQIHASVTINEKDVERDGVESPHSAQRWSDRLRSSLRKNPRYEKLEDDQEHHISYQQQSMEKNAEERDADETKMNCDGEINVDEIENEEKEALSEIDMAYLSAEPVENIAEPSPIISNSSASVDPNDDDLNQLHDCWPHWSLSQACRGWKQQVQLGMPGALSCFFEWGSFESAGIISAQLGQTQLAAHSIFVSTAMLLYCGVWGIAVGVGSLLGSYLGANEPQLAQRTAIIALKMGFAWGLFAWSFLVLGLRSVWGWIFSNDPEVIATVATMMWPLLFYGVFDSMKCVLNAIIRGCGRPGITVIGNLVSCYFIAAPLAIFFVIVLHYQLMSLWFAMTSAWLSASCFGLFILLRTDWLLEAKHAAERNNNESFIPIAVSPQLSKAPICDPSNPVLGIVIDEEIIDPQPVIIVSATE